MFSWKVNTTWMIQRHVDNEREMAYATILVFVPASLAFPPKFILGAVDDSLIRLLLFEKRSLFFFSTTPIPSYSSL